jgi:hypothetical protein
VAVAAECFLFAIPQDSAVAAGCFFAVIPEGYLLLL